MKLSSVVMAVWSVVSCGAAPLLHPRDDVLKPSEDPFYEPASGYKDAKLGQILKHRNSPVDPGILFVHANVAGAYQMQYRTENTFGEPITTIASVLVPYNADFTKVVLYSLPHDSSDEDCAPSYSILSGGDISNLGSSIDMLFIEVAMNQGWVVVAPDFDGPNATFTAGRHSGKAVLDSARAALQSNEITNIDSKAEFVLWGYSGGALANGWASALSSSYAPELPILGAALGGLPPNILDVFNHINGGPFVALSFLGLNGLSKEYPDMAELIESELVPDKKEQWDKAAHMCLGDATSYYANQNVWDYVKSGEKVLDDPRLKKTLKNVTMGVDPNEKPKFPQFWYQAKGDEMVPQNSTKQLYDTWCGEGVSIEYRVDLLSEHITQAIAGAPSAVYWMRDRFDKKEVEAKCSNPLALSNALDPKDIALLGEEIFNLLLEALGKPVGVEP